MLQSFFSVDLFLSNLKYNNMRGVYVIRIHIPKPAFDKQYKLLKTFLPLGEHWQ